MFREGVVEEVHAAEKIGPTAAQTLGLSEIHALLRGELTERECIAAIQQATRRYAKRQTTWFRKETGLLEVRAGSHAVEQILTGGVSGATPNFQR
jgi:tRNA dimethylallyltransferase